MLTSVTIHGNITYIGDSAFKDCVAFTDVIIDNGVKNISNHTFSGCTSLESIVIPISATHISSGVFDGCTLLTSVTFSGTKSQWNAIYKEYNWISNADSIIIHCTDGDIVAGV